ncbi:MAG: hypothetical protein ACRDM1_04110 [Gaiellaceae bacterium]
MLVRLVLWSLADADVTIETLRNYIRDEGVELYEHAPGLLFKAWVSDEASERWGAVFVWESREAAEQGPASRARELIGKDPEIVELFDLEATVSVAPRLRELGLAFE